jgi:hypothetical protein
VSFAEWLETAFWAAAAWWLIKQLLACFLDEYPEEHNRPYDPQKCPLEIEREHWGVKRDA